MYRFNYGGGLGTMLNRAFQSLFIKNVMLPSDEPGHGLHRIGRGRKTLHTYHNKVHGCIFYPNVGGGGREIARRQARMEAANVGV